MGKSFKFNNDVYLNGDKGISTAVIAWTPELSSISGVKPIVNYNYRRGEAIKIGRLVYIEFEIAFRITSIPQNVSYPMIVGIPFRARTNAGGPGFAVTLSEVYDCLNDGGGHHELHKAVGGLLIKTNGGAGTPLWKTSSSTVYWSKLSGAGVYLTND